MILCKRFNVITAKPQSKADCFTVGLAYGGEDILTAGWHNIQPSAEACQTSCQVLLLYLTSFVFRDKKLKKNVVVN